MGDSDVPTSPNAKHPRDQHTVKDAFAKIAAAQEEDKGDILSKELAMAEEAAKHNVSQFFEALASRCETDEERQELAKLMRHRQEEEDRWRLARSGGDASALPFPAASLEPPKSVAFTLDWWAQQGGKGKDRNEEPFPLRHFEPAPADDDTGMQVEVATEPTSLRIDAGLAGEAGWDGDTVTRSPSGATGGGRVPWQDPPASEGLTDAERVFLDKFWTSRGLDDNDGDGGGDGEGGGQQPAVAAGTAKEGGKAMDTSLTPGGWAEPAAAGVIAADVTLPEQDAVIAARAKRTGGKGDPLPPQIRARRVALLAKHFAEREAAKAAKVAKAAAAAGTQEAALPASPPRKVARSIKAVSAEAGAAPPLSPSPAFFQEKLEVMTAESAAVARAARVASEAAERERLAAEGAKLTAFGQAAVGAAYVFSSPTAKAKVDALMAKSEQKRLLGGAGAGGQGAGAGPKVDEAEANAAPPAPTPGPAAPPPAP